MEKENFDNFIALYKTGLSIKDINPVDNQTYKVLINSNVDIRIIDREQHLAEISMLSSLAHFSKDTKEYSNRFFYAIPIQTIKGTIVGFIFRSVFGKNYTTVNRTFSDKDKKLPLMFGFYNEFQQFDKYKNCPPIVICEGLKDCITLKRIYPFVLSNNTSSMGINLEVLSNLTDKFVLVYDNDKAGMEGMAKDKQRLLKSKFHTLQVTPKECYKDCADCSENIEDFKEFARELKQCVKSLINERDINLRRELIER